ncbi:MAG: Ig-like domain-containing protein [Flavobacterium sp.]|nr:Ig-like domain-containing protein [Flavobacterium sp.]
MNFLYKNSNNYASDLESTTSHKFSNLFKTIAVLAVLFVFGNTKAATYYSIATGNWNSNTTWSLTSGGTAVGTGVFPVAGDSVSIEGGFNVTLTANAACSSITFTATTATSLTLGIYQLDVSGTITIPRSGSSLNLIAVGAGTLNATSINFSSGGTSVRHQVTISTGIVSVSGDIVGANASASITFTGIGSLNVGGALLATGTLTTVAGSTVNYNGTSQTVKGGSYLGNLVLSGSGTKTFAAATTISGNLSITSGVVANLGTFSSTAATLTLGGTSQTTGTTYGSSVSTSAANKNATYFGTAGTGLITVGTACTTGTWTGTTSTDWNTASNWCNGTLPTASTAVTINSGGNQPTISSATAACSNITISSGATLTIAATGTLSVSGAITKTGTLTLATGSTINYAAVGAQTVLDIAYTNLTLSGSGIKTQTLGSNRVFSGNLIISSGATFTLAGTNTRTFTVTGTTDISGTFNLGTATATKTFTGNVTINSGGVWTEGGVATYSFGGNLVNNATTFTASTGTHTFTGTAKTYSGSTATAIPTVAITGTYTNSGTLTISTALSGTGSLTQDTNSTLNIGGTSAMTTFSASAVGNTVNYTGAAQTVLVTTYNNLTLSGSGAKTIATGTTTVNSILSIENGTTANTFTGTLAYGSGATLQYNSGSSARTVSTEWPTNFTSSGGILIKGTGIITLNAAKVLGNNTNVPLNITTGAKLATGNFQLTFNGDFTNSGTFTAGSSPIVITGATTTQYIAGFTTTGAVSMTKTSGTANITSSLNAAALTINGTSGILNLGTSLTHTFTGDITLTAGTLNGGALTTINANSTSTTAWNGSGTVFSPGTSTVVFGGVAQTIAASNPSFYNVSFSGTSATKTITNSLTVANNLNIISSAKLSLANGTNSTTKILQFNTISQTGGSYGFTGSGASNINTTNFIGGTGVINSSTANRFVITGASTQTAGASQSITITALDAAGNTLTSYTGDKSLTFSGAAVSPNSTSPKISNKTGTLVAFGSPTTITFNSGIAMVTSSNNGVMTLYNNEVAVISATDGTITSTGSDRLFVTVSSSTSTSLVFTSQPNGGNTNTVWTSQPVVTWQDTYGNPVTGTAKDVTVAIGTNPSSGILNGTKTVALSTVSGNATFSGLTIDKSGTGYTLIATATSVTQGTSTVFDISNPAPTLSNISPSTVCSGGSAFTLSLNGSNFNAASVVKVNGLARTTTFEDSANITAEILASDIINGGINYITVYTPAPGGGASSSVSLTVVQPSLNSNITQPSCFSDGSITLSPTGGTSPYTYDWTDLSGTSNPKDRSGLLPGNYSVLVTDASGCFANSGTITMTAATNCTGITVCKSDTASILSVPPDPNDTTYTWTLPSGAVGTSTTNSISVNWTGVAVGGYNVTVSGNNSCGTSGSSSIIIYVQEPTASASADLACTGGNLNLYASGGVSYSWTGPNSFTSQSANPVIYDISSAQNGTYTVAVTNAAGCTKTATVSVTVNTPPTIIDGAITQSTNGNSTGAIPITVSGGTSYSYLWTAESSAFSNTSQNLTGIPSDNYTVVVTNQTGCTASKTYTVSNSDGPTATATSTNTTCNGNNNGSITLSNPTGTGPFTYLWSGPNSFSSTQQSPTGLAAGSYSVLITDTSNSATGVASATITQPSSLQANGITTNINCYSGTTGAIALTVSGGSGPYTYAWNGTSFSATSKDISSLVSGTYNVTVTDANSCTLTQSFTITQPTAGLSATSSITNVSCYGSSTGQVVLSVNGGTSPYTYSWNGASFTASTKDISNKPAGTYSVTITDNKGCTLALTFGTAIVIAQPAAALSLSTASTNVNCKGNASGSITLTTSGGTSPYTYSWSNGITTKDLSNLAAGTYTVVVTDANSCTATTTVTITQPANNLSASNSATNVSCNGGTTGEINVTSTGGTTPYTYLWSTGATTEDLSAIAAGTYSVVVTDANGCTANSSATLTQQAAISVSGSVTNVLCNGSSSGAITLTASGGTGTYTYNWGGGITSQNRTNLAAGTYTVTVMDASSCSSADTSFIITQSPTIVINSVKKNISCKSASNGSISLSVSGGNYPYSYSWTGSNGYTATTQNIDNIPAGNYSITVTDANSCSATENGIILTQPSAVVSVVTTPTDATCQGGSNGSINAIASGGTSPYSYAWSTGANTTSINGLSKGPYSVLVTDANGCTLNQNVSVSEPSTKLELYANVKESSSCGNATGSIELTVVNGNAPFSYSWTNTSQTTANPSALAAGTFTATVTDVIGCTANLEVTVTTATALSASITTYPKTCLYNDGSAYAIVSGGVAPYTFLWNNGATSQNIGLLGSGNVSVTITDANGCTTSPTGMIGSISCLAPIAVNDTFNTNYLTSLNGTVATNDSDPDALDQDHLNLQYFSTQNPTPAQGVLNWGTDYDGNFNFVPATGFAGTFTLTYEVFDPTGLSATGTYTITVGPSAVNDALGTPLDTAFSSNVYSNDIYANGSAFSKLTDPLHGTLIFNSNGTFTYTPTTGYSGDDSFTYKICLGAPNETVCSNTATVLISVDGSADVAIANTISNATPNVGSNIIFTLIATNNGPNSALNVSVTDALPTGYTYVSNTTSIGSFDSASGEWTVGSLANAASVTMQITASVNPSGNYVNTATITSGSIDPGSSNNSASVSATPVPQSDISISGSVNNASQSEGSSVTFTITVANSGPNNAEGVNVSDLLPNGYTYISSSPGSGTYNNNTGIWTIGNLSNGSAVTLTITATVNNSGNYSNTAVVSSNTNDPISSNNSASQVVTPGAVSNLSLTKTINNANPYVGGLVEFTLTATNNGPSNATGVSVIDSLPSGYTYNSDNGNGAYSASTGNWTIGNLNNGSTKTLKIYAIVKAAGNYTNSALISSTDQPDNDSSNNNPSVSPTSVVAQADLSIVKTVNTSNAVIGNNVIFTLTVTNNGPSDATGVSVNDLLPSGYTYVSNSISSGTYESGTGIWDVGSISNGAIKTISITVSVNSTGNYINVATVNATTADLSSGNNTSSKTVTPIPLLIINNPAAVCYPATVDITASTITSGSSDNLIYSYWNDSNTISPYSTPTQATNGTYYIKATTSSGNFTIEPVFVTVNSTSVAGSISGAAMVCSGTNSTILTLSGNTGTIQWQSSSSLVGTYSDISSATSTNYNASNLTATTFYRALVTSGVCSSANTSSVLITVLSSNVWSGSVSSAWNIASNWSCGVPASGDNIEIPGSLTNYPILDGPRTIGSLLLASGATINLNNSTLAISGVVTGTGTLIGSTTSSLTINGLGNQGTFYMNQTTPGTSNAVANFTLNSTSTGSATLGNAIGIYGTLTLTNGTFNTGGNLTLMSNGTSTAVVAPITDCSAVAINGDVTVERYFPARRAFRFISSPVTTTTTIRDNWQEGVNNPPPAYITNLNPHPGYGTHITGNITADYGFDVTQTTNNSMFTFNNSTGVWAAVPNTSVLTLTAGVPYRLLIRGDRSISMSTNAPSPTNTTLRVKGALKICDASAGTMSTTANGYNFIGNPYQAKVDIKQVLEQNANFNTNFYWVWDPKINSRGGYVAYNLSTNQNPVSGSHVNQYLQPWQGCFIKNGATAGGSITFHESNKSTSIVNENVYKTTSSLPAHIRATLYESNTLATSGVAADGLIVNFDANYNNLLDAYDAPKLTNQDEIFATINSTSLLAIESRTFPVDTDVIPLSITQYRNTNYTIVAQGNNMSGLPAYLHDQLLQTYTEIPHSDSVSYSYFISTTDTATSAPDRFRIVFQNPNLSTTTNSNLVFTMYPNPSKQGVFDLVMNNSTEDTKLSIYNSIGQEVYITYLSSTTINHIKPNKVFATGVYYVKIFKEGETITKKLIIE